MGKIIFASTALGYPKATIYDDTDGSVFCYVKTRTELVIDIDSDITLRAKMGPNLKSNPITFSADMITEVTLGFSGIKTAIFIVEQSPVKEYQENNYPYGKPDFEFIGPRGRSLLVYEDKCVFIKKGTYGTLIGKTADNEKTIYYHDVVGVKYKRVNNTNGYLQLQTASNITRLNSDDYYDDNTFPFGPDIEYEVKIAAEYIQEKVNNAKTRSTVVATGPISAADEIKKFKELLDMGVITQEEFDAKKKQLLGL